jgi:hypothetical protein
MCRHAAPLASRAALMAVVGEVEAVLELCADAERCLKGKASINSRTHTKGFPGTSNDVDGLPGMPGKRGELLPGRGDGGGLGR